MNILFYQQIRDMVYEAKKDRFFTEYNMIVEVEKGFVLDLNVEFKSFRRDSFWCIGQVFVKSGKIEKELHEEIRTFLFDSEEPFKTELCDKRMELILEQEAVPEIRISSFDVKKEKVNKLGLFYLKVNFFLMPEKQFIDAMIQEKENGTEVSISLQERNNRPIQWDSGNWYAGWSEDLRALILDEIKKKNIRLVC